MKKVAMAGTTLRVGGAAFLHNATLCKKALGKKLLAQVVKRTCFF
jgi:hypothetical protein